MSDGTAPARDICEQGTPDVEDTKKLPVDMFYDYEQLVSKASVSPESDLPLHLLHLSHSFGYDCKRRANLQLLDEQTLAYIAGNILVLQDMSSMEQRYLRSSSGGGIGAITTHPDRQYFAVGEKGSHPNIIIYQYPSLRPYRLLRGGTGRAYCHLDFSGDGALLASVGAAPDYMLTLWDWRQEEVVLSCKAVSQDRVSFSPHDFELLTSAGSGHIQFWKMANTVTGLKLQGLMGHFGKKAVTDIQSFVVLPDGKVVSGSVWGNLLLWDGNSIKVEICRKEGRPCHSGAILPFGLEEGQLLTTGADGAVRGWDVESINSADSHGEGSCFEMEPMNELLVGNSVGLSSVVRSGLADSFVWYAQDTMGAIWKLDLSFTHTFHSGAIQGMDVSRTSHLLATTALGRSLKVYDFLSKKQLTSGRFNQGGTALCWAPPLVDQGGGLLVVGFEDGVVRLLDLFDARRLQTVSERSRRGGAELRLRQAFKPHSASVRAVAYDRNARILATASSDCSVFFFSAGEKYRPIGFVSVPGPVQTLEWSPHSHSTSCLLVLCQTGHVLEVQSPDPELSQQTQTFELSMLQTRLFRFKSIKSRIKREEEIARRQAVKEQGREEDLEEKEEKLPPIFLPSPPSPLCCGFYSQPGRFWLSMGGYDAGFLYHCEFSESQDEDPTKRQDEPFTALPIHNADQDPIVSVTFSSERRLLLCGMTSGSVRVYPLRPGDHSLESLQHYWTLSIHDNSYGAVQHVRLSHDDQFVLTAGDDGNIFSFSLLPPDKLPQTAADAKVPSPRAGLENEEVAQDIVDPSAYSIATAKQKQKNELLQREVEQKILSKRMKLEDLRKSYKQLLKENQTLATHVQLQPQELCLDVRFVEQAERSKEQRLREVQRMYAWEEERSRLALHNLQHWFKDSSVVTVVAIASDHRVSTYRLPSLPERAPDVRRPSQSSASSSSGAEARRVRAELGKGGAIITEEELVRPAPLVTRPGKVKLADRQMERLKKAAEKAEQARIKIENRKKEWAQLFAEKPDEDSEDPADVQAIHAARETVGYLKLKTAPDFTVPKHLRMNTERKREELSTLQQAMRRRQVEMNAQILALRDAKVRLVAHLQSQSRLLESVRERLPAQLHRPRPPLPCILPEETPEKRLHYSTETLRRYKELRQRHRAGGAGHEKEETDLLQLLEKEGPLTSDQSEATEQTTDQSRTDVESEGEEQVENTDLEDEVQMEEQVRRLHQQDVMIEQMEAAMREWDASLRMLLHQKLCLDQDLKLADLRQLTLFQEVMLLKHFEAREDSLQEELNVKASEEDAVTLRLEELTEELESKQWNIFKVQRQLKALSAAFMASLGENSKFEEFLTRVFKKKIKRLKEKAADEVEDEEEEEDWLEDEDEDEDKDSTDLDTWEGPLDDSVCPPKCEPALFENTLQLRERRLDLEEQLQEEKKSIETLKKDLETLAKKKNTVSSSRQAIEEDLEMIQREKQQQMNELDVAVPLRLHQVEFLSDTELLTDFSQALVLDSLELRRLRGRISELQQEKSHQRELFHQARQQRVRLQQECTQMEARIQGLQKECDELMLRRFGRLVDLQALQTLSGNMALEELKQDKLQREAKYDQEIKKWDLKVLEARDALMKATRDNTECMANMNRLFTQKKELEHTLHQHQRRMGRDFEDGQRRQDQQDIVHLQELLRAQAEQAQALYTEIQLLSRKGGHVLPPGPAHQPGPASRPPGSAHQSPNPHSSM